MTDVVIVSPPRLIGSAEVRRIFGWYDLKPIYNRLRKGDPMLMCGYMGKIHDRHVWNAHLLLSGLFSSAASLDEFIDGAPRVGTVCADSGCTFPADYAGGLCYRHFAKLLTKIRQAERSSMARAQLVAMCRWVVERNADLIIPEFNPWSDLCALTACDEPIGHRRIGPFCRTHMRMFYGHPDPP